jgi:hypothetical protein
MLVGAGVELDSNSVKQSLAGSDETLSFDGGVVDDYRLLSRST